jgi:hypothetical protein
MHYAYSIHSNDLVVWCKDNNISFNVIKTKEMIVDYWKRRAPFSSTAVV